MHEKFFLAFIPLFVAIDVLAVVPIFLSFTDGMKDKERRRLMTASTFTAFAISMAFLAVGKFVFSVLGITENDFRIGGGILLLTISVRELLVAREGKVVAMDQNMGVVPLGIPLIIGPAALTTILILVDDYGYALTAASLIVNLAIVWLALSNAHILHKIMGRAGALAFARVMAIFLAGIAVMMIRVGVKNSLP